MYLLDTNVISELRKAGSGRADKNVLCWATDIPPASLFLSVITIFEIETGILQIAQRNEALGELLRQWLEGHVLKSFTGRILPIDLTIAKRCAGLHIPDPRSERDALIASTALVHGMIVVTRNVRDFVATGVRVLNPWEAANYS